MQKRRENDTLGRVYFDSRPFKIYFDLDKSLLDYHHYFLSSTLDINEVTSEIYAFQVYNSNIMKM